MMRTLSVWWDGVIVGALQVNQHGQMRFTYAADWLSDGSRPAISFSLPKRERPFTQRQCRPFFAGLLPEGRGRRSTWLPGGGASPRPVRAKWRDPAVLEQGAPTPLRTALGLTSGDTSGA